MKGTTNPYQTVLTILVGFTALLLINDAILYLWVIVAVGLASILFERLAVLIDRLWAKLAWLLSLFVPKILLSAVFFLVLVPLALASRMFSKDPLNLINNEESTFKTVSKSFPKKSFEQPW